MRFSKACSGLVLSTIASAAHIHHGIDHQHAKRDLEVVTLTDIVWDVVTVTEYDLASVATNALVSSASSSTTTTVPSPPAVAQTSTNTPVVAVPITTSQPPAQVSPSTSQTSSPSPSSPEAVAVTVAVAAAPTTATVESAAATSPDAAASTTTTTTASGEYSGDGTFYELGLTACGQTYTDSDYVAAISYLLFDQDATANPNDNPHCGKKIAVYREGKSVDVTIVDRCAGCENMYSVDLSPVAFDVLGTPAEGRIPITWSYA